MTTETPPTPAVLRELIAASGVKLYALAARVGVHPSKLGQLLSGRVPLTPALAERIRRAIEG